MATLPELCLSTNGRGRTDRRCSVPSDMRTPIARILIPGRIVRVAALSAALWGCDIGSPTVQFPPAADAGADTSSPSADARPPTDGGVDLVDGVPAPDAQADLPPDLPPDRQPDQQSDRPDGGGVTVAGVPLPPGWTLRHRDKFGTGPGSTITGFTQLHAKYYEAMYYNRDASGRVKIPNTVINREQQTYSPFEKVIVWSPDHLTIQARGQPDGTITSGELVSVYTTRDFCAEARYRIPREAGSWPAFWFYGAATGGDKSEIDVEQPITPNQGVADVSLYNHPSQSDIVIADPAFTTRWMTWSKPSFDASAGVHTYTVCYDDAAALVSRHIDGAPIYSATFKWNASLGGTGKGPDAAAIINLAVGGSWPGNVANPTTFVADFDVYSIDYYGP